jgi:hypothetical protein
MWDGDSLLDFDNIDQKACLFRQKKALARGGGKIGGTRLELGIAWRKKTLFMHCLLPFE